MLFTTSTALPLVLHDWPFPPQVASPHCSSNESSWTFHAVWLKLVALCARTGGQRGETMEDVKAWRT